MQSPRFTIIRADLAGSSTYSVYDSMLSVTNSFSDASLAIQFALDLAAASSGATVELGDGTFILNSPLTIRGSRICVSGNGMATRLVIHDGANALHIDAVTNQLDYIEISSLSIEGTYTTENLADASCGLKVEHRTAFLNVRDVTIINCRLAMALDSLFKPRMENITIRDCWMGIEARGDRIKPHGKRGETMGCELRLINSNIERIDHIGVYAHDNTSGIIMSHVEIGWVGDFGLLFENFDWAHLTAVLIDTFRQGHDLDINPRGIAYKFNNVRGVQISNCWAGSFGGTGMHIENCKQFLLNNIQFRPPYKIGIYCSGLPENMSEEITISSCQFSVADDVAIWMDHDVYRSRVSGNSISHCLNGIKETGNCDFNSFGNNEVWGNRTVDGLQVSGLNSKCWHNRIG